MSLTIGDEFAAVPPDAAAVVSVAPLGAAVVSDESPLLHAAASNEIAAIAASASLTDVIRFRISTFPISHMSQNPSENSSYVDNPAASPAK